MGWFESADRDFGEILRKDRRLWVSKSWLRELRWQKWSFQVIVMLIFNLYKKMFRKSWNLLHGNPSTIWKFHENLRKRLASCAYTVRSDGSFVNLGQKITSVLFWLILENCVEWGLLVDYTWCLGSLLCAKKKSKKSVLMIFQAVLAGNPPWEGVKTQHR